MKRTLSVKILIGEYCLLLVISFVAYCAFLFRTRSTCFFAVVNVTYKRVFSHYVSTAKHVSLAELLQAIQPRDNTDGPDEDEARFSKERLDMSEAMLVKNGVKIDQS